MHLRMRVKKVGTHYRCRVFSGNEAKTTHAMNGELVFDEREWPEVKELLTRIAEVIEENSYVQQ
jgi:hypothetical protein